MPALIERDLHPGQGQGVDLDGESFGLLVGETSYKEMGVKLSKDRSGSLEVGGGATDHGVGIGGQPFGTVRCGRDATNE